MTRLKSTPVSETALSGSMRDFRVPQGPDALARVGNFFAWQDERRRHGVWPFSRAAVTGPGATVSAEDDSGHAMQGVNFASQDYLSLASHPAIRAAAIEAIETYGVHSAGSSALVGNSANSLLLERRIGEFLNAEHVTLYPTGWGAGYGALRGLIRSSDHIVMDALAHTCLQEGANAATRNLYMHRHLDLAHCRHWLQKIRARDTENAIMVVTEGLFSMDSDVPDIEAFQALAHEFGATLMVDVAHDLGALGPGGRGHIGAQNMLGKVDLVMGSFSKTFGSNGGFVATKSRAVKAQPEGCHHSEAWKWTYPSELFSFGSIKFRDPAKKFFVKMLLCFRIMCDCLCEVFDNATTAVVEGLVHRFRISVGSRWIHNDIHSDDLEVRDFSSVIDVTNAS